MSEIALELEHVYKKFRRGEIYDSLRDLIPAIAGKLIRNRRASEALAEREFWALRDIHLQIGRGEAFGIIGSNGAGKSTMLKVLSGIMKPTQGAVHVHGKLSALIEVSAGFHPDLTGRENVYLNGTILGMRRDEIRARFDEIVAFSGLEEFIDTPVKRYSSGMFARLGFSVAAHVDPDILIVDEVLSVGDFVFQRKCVERMNEVIRGGATVVFVSHNLRAVADLCTRSVLLERGQVVAEGTTSTVIKTYLDRGQVGRSSGLDKEAYVSRVAVRGARGEAVRFTSGERVWVDVEVRSNTACPKAALVLEFRDESHYEVFNTSTERLGFGTVDFEPGETRIYTFAIDLHFAVGTFYIGATLYRYDTQHKYDRWFPATSLFVTSETDVRGVVNLNPTVIVHAKRMESGALQSAAGGS